MIKKDCHIRLSVIESNLCGFNLFKKSSAGVSEWQTKQTQNLRQETACGFKSHHRHHEKVPGCLLITAFPGLFLILKYLSIYGLLRQPEQRILKKTGEVDIPRFSVGIQPCGNRDVFADSLLSMGVGVSAHIDQD